MNIRWIHRMWLRILALVLAAGLTAFGLISIAAAPLWPVVGVAVATLALCWNGMTSRLDKPLCLNCGDEINKTVGSQYGVICKSCGCLNEPIGEIRHADAPSSPNTIIASSIPTTDATTTAQIQPAQEKLNA